MIVKSNAGITTEHLQHTHCHTNTGHITVNVQHTNHQRVVLQMHAATSILGSQVVKKGEPAQQYEAQEAENILLDIASSLSLVFVFRASEPAFSVFLFFVSRKIDKASLKP